MSRLVQSATVRTNARKDSVCRIDVPAVTFKDLWDNYVTGDPYKPAPDDKGDYSNQCALRMSATFHRLGIEMKSFSQKTVKPMPGATVLGRVIMNGKPAAARAYELGEWLRLQPFCGLPRAPEDITGKDWESKIKGRTGIVMFHAYWARPGESTGGGSGGHIDLWNGQRLTISSFQDIGAVVGRGLGVESAHVPFTSWGYSDLRKARLILFWEVR